MAKRTCTAPGNCCHGIGMPKETVEWQLTNEETDIRKLKEKPGKRIKSVSTSEKILIATKDNPDGVSRVIKKIL